MIRFLIILLLCLSTVTTFSQGAPIQLKACGHHDYAPWNWKSGNKIQGVCAEVTKALFAKVGAEVDLTYVGPWKRCQSYIESGQVDINICSFVNENRKKYSKFIQTPMGFNENAVFVKKGNEFSFNKWNDLADRKTGMVLGVSIGQEFDSFLKKNTTIERVASYKQNFYKLLHNRVDFIPVGRFSGQAILNSFNLQDEIIDLPTPILIGKLYISMSKKSPYLYLLPEVEKYMQEDDYQERVKSLVTKYIDLYAEEGNVKLSVRDD